MSGETSNKSIGTHNGKFHADEVVGCMLLKCLPEYKLAEIIRSRDPNVLSKCDIVIDVGGVYDHSLRRYDHHQRDFCETLWTVAHVKETIKLSSAGLVWAHYGKPILEEVTNHKLKEDDLHLVYCRMYDFFIKEIDAKDNGINVASPPFRYEIHTSISCRIGRMNPNSFCENLDEETQFQKAVALAKQEFLEMLDDTLKSWLPFRGTVSDAIDKRYDVDKSGMIIMLSHPGIRWPDHLRALEEEKGIKPPIKFVLFPDNTIANGWRVQAVSRDGSFLLRLPVMPKFKGFRDDELREACGIEDAVFVHATGFIAGAKTYEGVLKMAQMTLSEETELPPPLP